MVAYTLEIVTPSGTVYSGSVVSLLGPGSQGAFGVLARHAPMITAMRTGRLSFKEDGVAESRMLACSGGFVEVSTDRVTILAETAEFGDEIDLARAQEARDRAKERLDQHEDVDRIRAEASLSRALNRIDLAGSM